MSVIKNILEKLRPVDPEAPKNEESSMNKVTNQVLYDELLEHFKYDMDEKTVGKRILYPMSFNILIHPIDYERVGESLPFILPEVIAAFYAAIKAKSKSIPDSCSTPPATYWFFQFASSTVKTKDKEEAFLNPGEIVTVAHLSTFDIKRAQTGTRTGNYKLSIKCQNSNVNETNINPEALLGMEILTNNTYIFNFDKTMSQSRDDIVASQRNANNALATLTYSDGPDNVHLSMMDDLVTLSGPKETRNGDSILIINHNAVQVGHVQIKYIRETNKFQMCAYAKTRLNSREVPISVGGTPVWVDMSLHSDLFLNDEVNVKFKASEAIVSRSLLS